MNLPVNGTSDELANRANQARVLVARGRYREAMRLLEPLRDALRSVAPRSPEDALRVVVLRDLGICYYELRDFPKARECVSDGAALARSAGDERMAGSCLHELAMVCLAMNDLLGAAEACHSAIRLTLSAGAEPVEAMQQYAIILQMAGHFANAGRILAIVREMCEACGDLDGAAKALHEHGMASFMGGDDVVATVFFVEAIRLRRVIGDKAGALRTRGVAEEFFKQNPRASSDPTVRALLATLGP